MGFLVIQSLAFLLVLKYFSVETRLEPTKFENNKVYALENQHGGKVHKHKDQLLNT